MQRPGVHRDLRDRVAPGETVVRYALSNSFGLGYQRRFVLKIIITGIFNRTMPLRRIINVSLRKSKKLLVIVVALWVGRSPCSALVRR